MSLSRRLLDLARANVNALLDRSGKDARVEDLSDQELEAELERRRARKSREEAERAARVQAERAAADKIAGERAQARGKRPASSQRASSKSQRPPRSAPVAAQTSEARLRECYALLEVQYGVAFEEVKQSFRRLMRKYHPDMHHGDAKKHKAATELTMSLTRAYEEIEASLSRR